jgi:LmbE family N-acetylglucosaminyl deacetylase
MPFDARESFERRRHVTMEGRRALFLFAHQDDEYAAVPWILEELSAGSEIVCLYFTDGGSRVAPAVRDAETRSVLLSLGVAGRSIVFLTTAKGRIGDLELAARSAEALDALERWMERSSFVPDRVYAPSYEGGHPDHDAAHVIAASIVRRRNIDAEAWAFSLYHAFGCPRPLFFSLRQLPSQAESRRARMPPATRWWAASLCWRYRSQWRTWLGLFPGALWERAILGRESIVRFDLERLSKRPHEGALLYERLFGMKYGQFADLTHDVVSTLPPAR